MDKYPPQKRSILLPILFVPTIHYYFQDFAIDSYSADKGAEYLTKKIKSNPYATLVLDEKALISLKDYLQGYNVTGTDTLILAENTKNRLYFIDRNSMHL